MPSSPVPALAACQPNGSSTRYLRLRSSHHTVSLFIVHFSVLAFRVPFAQKYTLTQPMQSEGT